MKIYKYPLTKYPLTIGTTEVELPRGAKILTVDMQGDDLCLWAVVDPMAKTDVRLFRVFGTGHTIETLQMYDYVGTALAMEGALVCHVFEVLELRDNGLPAGEAP